MSKPQIEIDLDSSTGSFLRAETLLSRLLPGTSHHEDLDCRHPLGIYNVSISRILKKINNCANRAENLFTKATRVTDLDDNESIRDELIDYIELCLYAAAEHVDDIASIQRCFFTDAAPSHKSPHSRNLVAKIKPIRDRISGYTNAIKHQQSRIRIFSVDFEQAAGSVCLHGFFIAQFSNGSIGPSLIWHSSERVISVAAFLWSVMLYLHNISEALCSFLIAMGATKDTPAELVEIPLLRECAIQLARLPLYSFDDEHPFIRARFTLNAGPRHHIRLDSGLYGSLIRKWSKSNIAAIGQYVLGYEGDGTTRQFQLNYPTRIQLQHWD